MLAIAIPVSVQSLFQASLSVVDQFMVGQLGKNAIATVGLGSRFPFIFLITSTAIAATTSILISQFWSKKDTKNIANALGGTMLLGILLTVIFLTLSLAFSKQILSIYTNDSSIVKLGSHYLRITAIGYIPMLIIALYSAVLRSTEHMKTPMYVGLFAILLNSFLNYLLIFGILGFPKLGLFGTAYATTITRFIEALLLLSFIYIKKYPGSFKINELFNFSLQFIKKVLIISSPILINEFMWALGETMYSIVYGRMGTNEVASMTLTYPIQSLCIGLFTGLSSAAGIMVGNKLGLGENEQAYDYSKKFIELGIIGSICSGLILILFSNVYTSIFNVSNDLKSCTFRLLVVFSSVLWIKVSNMIIGSGILRSGGKTKYTLYLDMLGTWGIGVPIGFISAFFLKIPIEYVYLLICSEELVRFIIGIKLVYSRKWMKNLNEAEPDSSVPEVI